MPCSVRFETVYKAGEVTAVSYTAGKEISRDTLVTTGEPAAVRIALDKGSIRTDGHDLVYASVEIVDSEGRVVPDAEVSIKAGVSGAGYLAGFGSANPVTEEDYTDDEAVTYRGRAMAIVRSGYEAGTLQLEVTSETLGSASADFSVI